MRARLGSLAGFAAAGTLALVPMLATTAAPAAAAVANVAITEVAPWGSGATPYAVDWFEVTNLGSTSVDITGWRMDDNSNSFALSVPLAGITSIAAGQSVIFMETATPATTIPLFTNAWFGASVPSGFTAGSYSGSGVGLSQSGDAVNLFDSAGNLVTGVTFGANSATGPFRSFDNAAGAGSSTLPTPTISALSSAGTNGAFLGADGLEVGSPGTITNPVTPPSTTVAATTTVAPTSSTAAGSTTAAPTYLPWPGSQNVQTVDLAATFSSNLSGLDYEASGSTAPGVIWGAVNGPGSLYRLVFDGTNWVPDTSSSWGAGKAVRYPTGLGDPDSEGVTYVGSSAAVDGLYVSTERDNTNNTVSRLSVLRFDPTAAGTTLTATHEWNLTADIPPTGANLGLEAITWIPDSYLTSKGLVDSSKGRAYNPADYPNHGTGLFFVGVEGSGMVYGYALNKSDSSYQRITSFSGGFSTIMELQFDQDLGKLWAVCDNTCNGRHHVLAIDPATGTFGVTERYERPTGMGNYNNEGFAIAPAALCVDGQKPVFWADDSDDLGFSLRSGTLPCAADPTPVVPEFPIGAVPALAAVVALGALVFVRSRRPSTV